MTSFRSRRRVLVALAVATLAAGCASSPPPALFTLVPLPGPVLDTPVGAVAVGGVEIAKYLDRPQIVRFRTPYEITVSDVERWDEALDVMATRVLVEDLSLRLPGGTVTVAASTVTPQAATGIAVDIARFDPEPDGPAVLEARWTIVRDGSAANVRLERITVAPASPATADLVAAMSQCLAQLSDHLAQALAAPR